MVTVAEILKNNKLASEQSKPAAGTILYHYVLLVLTGLTLQKF